MNNYREWTMIGPRGSGRTTALIEAAKSINAIFVCHNADDARRTQSKGIKATHIHSIPQGTRGPYIFDHAAVEAIVNEYEHELVRVTAERDEAMLDLCCEAYGDIIDWACYADEYFQTKHRLQDDLDKWKARIHEYARRIHEKELNQ